MASSFLRQTHATQAANSSNHVRSEEINLIDDNQLQISHVDIWFELFSQKMLLPIILLTEIKILLLNGRRPYTNIVLMVKLYSPKLNDLFKYRCPEILHCILTKMP